VGERPDPGADGVTQNDEAVIHKLKQNEIAGLSKDLTIYNNRVVRCGQHGYRWL